MRIIFSLVFLLTTLGLVAQQYTDCQNAFKIQDPIEWCSNSGQFNNENVGASGYGAATCWTNNDNDVWFEFTSFALAVNIVIDGSAGNNDLLGVQAALYTGTCGGVINEVNCQTGFGTVNVFETGLIIGQKYYLRVNGVAGSQGKFSVCINNYNPPTEPGQDCFSGAVLCDKSPFVVQSVSGSGTQPDEADGSCLGAGGSLSENQSTWFKWTAANNGSLTFTISPLKTTDDLDFALYEISDIGNCGTKTLLRCVATSCSGPTGLNLESTDVEEDLNCEPGEDGFVQFINMEEGKSYALIVNNFTSSGVGFSMEWGGTGEFLGPDPDFMIIPESGLSCDQEFEIVNTSTSPPQINITSYSWDFGERAIPGSSTAENPPNVEYEKFGEKYVVLTVETDKGCIVTEVQPLYAEPCCDDLFDIEVDGFDIENATCPGFSDGSFSVVGSGGNPEYEYDLNNSGNFSERAKFENLSAGTYKVNVIDIKGCTDSTLVVLTEPEIVQANAGPDKTTVLGFGTELEGSYDPPGENVTLSWSSVPADPDMSCFDCLEPEIIPPGTTVYTLKVTSESGCMTFDDVTVRVKLERPVYEPNIFTPNEDGSNDIFTIFTNRAAKNLDVLSVYDRWGNRVYEGTDLELNNPTVGWDGMFNGRPAQQGVYAWFAKITFVDNVTVDYKGTVTLNR